MSSAFQAWSESRIYKYLLFYPCLKVLLWYFQLYFQCEQNSSELNTMWKQRKRILQSQVTFDHKRSRYINGLLANPLCLQRICSSAPQHVQECREVGHNRKNTQKKVQISGKTGNNRKQLLQLNITQTVQPIFFFYSCFSSCSRLFLPSDQRHPFFFFVPQSYLYNLVAAFFFHEVPKTLKWLTPEAQLSLPIPNC